MGAVLLALVALGCSIDVDQARHDTTRARLKQLENALAIFELENGALPTTEEGLAALRRGKVPDDAWGNAFHYRQPGVHNPAGFDLWSLGADFQPGGECEDADLGNWEGADPRECRAWGDIPIPAVLPAATLGAMAGLLLGLPFYLGLTLRRAVRARSWRPLVRVRPLVALLGLSLLVGALFASMFGVIA